MREAGTACSREACTWRSSRHEGLWKQTWAHHAAAVKQTWAHRVNLCSTLADQLHRICGTQSRCSTAEMDGVHLLDFVDARVAERGDVRKARRRRGRRLPVAVPRQAEHQPQARQHTLHHSFLVHRPDLRMESLIMLQSL
jgi:hypothetical protein